MLWSSSWACNKKQILCWGVQQIARRGLCVSFSFLLCVSVSLCFSAFFVSCLRVSFCVCARCAWDCHRLFLMTCTEQYGDNGNMKRVLRHESFAHVHCVILQMHCASCFALCIVSFFRCIVHRACRCALCHYLDAISTCSGCIYSRRCCCNARWDCAFNRMAQFDAWWFCTIYLLSRHRWHSGWYTADATNRIHTNSPRAVDCWLVQPFLKGGHFWRGPPRWHKMIAPLLFWWRSYLKRCAVACLQLTGGGEGRSQLKTLLKSQLHSDLGSTHGKRNTTGQNQKALIWY